MKRDRIVERLKTFDVHWFSLLRPFNRYEYRVSLKKRILDFLWPRVEYEKGYAVILKRTGFGYFLIVLVITVYSNNNFPDHNLIHRHFQKCSCAK